MHQLMNISQGTTVAMSTCEIADLCEKEHGNVLRDCREMLFQLKIDVLSFESIFLDSYGRKQPCLSLPKDLTLTLVSGYSVILRKRIIDRMNELECASLVTTTLPANYSEALRRLADSEDEKIAALALANHAIATKAEIGNRREATAMNTASQATKKVTALQIELDQSKLFSSVKRMQMIYHGQKFDWRKLKSAAQEMEIGTIDIFDANYGKVKSYHADVWLEVYALPIESGVSA